MQINIKNNPRIYLATGADRMTRTWENKTCRWSELLERCKEPKRTPETFEEYKHMSKEKQCRTKDVGGFVGGHLAGGERKKTNVLFRSLATLDIDFGTPYIWDDFTLAFNFAAMLYSTHSHSEDNPRYRLVFPLSRRVTVEEYEPLCRKIAEILGINLFDGTTFEAARLFFFPSASSDADYIFKYQDGPTCNVDGVLGQYKNYKDVTTWARCAEEDTPTKHEVKKAEDPTKKPGLIGAFCRAYTIEDAIDTFLGEQYTHGSTGDRYTYREGTTANGLVCYDGKYAYSHHDTDPAGRKLCNAFDLCRIHLFGHRDEGETPEDVTQCRSFVAMQEFASCDKRVKLTIAREREQELKKDFENISTDPAQGDEWKAELDTGKNGRPRNTIENIVTILENDKAVAGKIKHNEFSGFDTVSGPLPWGKEKGQWIDRDDANLRAWLEVHYDIAGKNKIDDALSVVLTRHTYHPVRDYLSGLKWDGVPRLDTLIIDYLGAEDNELNRNMTRKHFTGAVARIFSPGCKYDYCLVITGPEGVGKSSLLNIMGGEGFNDSVFTMEGKEGMSQLRGAWLIELGELSGIRRSDVEQVKAFLSKQTDIYRAAYDRRTTEHPRQCVFCGTTNEVNFLKGDHGNRRFWVIQVNPELRKFDDWRQRLQAERDQIWAEAVQRYKDGEKLYLTDELEQEAREVQHAYSDEQDDPMPGMLKKFLDTKLPADWKTFSMRRRRAWWSDPDPLEAYGVEVRERFSPIEFVCEFLGHAAENPQTRYTVRKINRLMNDNPEWEPVSCSRHCEDIYGRQRGYIRKTKIE